MNPSPFYLYVSSKIGFQMQKRTFLAKMLFLLRFGCCFCCFSKSREPGDVPTYMYPQNFAFICKKALFQRKCCFCCFCCVLSVAFVVFQNLVNQEMLLPIFIFLIRRLVKKLFHFEVMFRQGGRLLYFTSMRSTILTLVLYDLAQN